MNRRALLRNGALTISFGALTAACGGAARRPPEAPGRLGLADVTPELVEEPITDVILLRTAQSIEYTALDVYAAAIATESLPTAANSLVDRFVADHQRHANSLGELITQLGGEPFACANPFLTERAVAPVLGALDGTDDIVRDLFNIAYAFESLAGASYQALVTMLADRGVRVAAMTIGSEEHRHAAALGAAMNPDVLVSPAVSGGQVGTDDDNIPLRYAIPSQFGRIDGIDLVVGAVNDEGSRFSTQLQTPAANTLVYTDASC